MKRTVFILSASSDIGLTLAKRYLKAGHTVVGTYRNFGRLKEIERQENCHLFLCDIGNKNDINKLSRKIARLKITWDTFISCVGDISPVAHFFESDFDRWSQSIHINAIEQLRVLHGLYPARKKEMANCIFFAGGGINKAVTHITAYTTAKIMLVKMCEFLDAENYDMNIFIIGPGWVKTKIHQPIVNDVKVSQKKREETLEFLKKSKDTNMLDIFNLIEWAIKNGKKVAGGRNFSVKFDSWKGSQAKTLVKELKTDINMYKLRRYRSFNEKETNSKRSL